MLRFFKGLFGSRKNESAVAQSAPMIPPGPQRSLSGREITPESCSPVRPKRPMRHSLCPATPSSPLKPTRRLRFSTIERRTRKRRRSTLWRRLEESSPNQELPELPDSPSLKRVRIEDTIPKSQKFEEWKRRKQGELFN
jgi:hypothetical protein